MLFESQAREGLFARQVVAALPLAAKGVERMRVLGFELCLPERKGCKRERCREGPEEADARRQAAKSRASRRSFGGAATASSLSGRREAPLVFRRPPQRFFPQSQDPRGGGKTKLSEKHSAN